MLTVTYKEPFPLVIAGRATSPSPWLREDPNVLSQWLEQMLMRFLARTSWFDMRRSPPLRVPVVDTMHKYNILRPSARSVVNGGSDSDQRRAACRVLYLTMHRMLINEAVRPQSQFRHASRA